MSMLSTPTRQWRWLLIAISGKLDGFLSNSDKKQLASTTTWFRDVSAIPSSKSSTLCAHYDGIIRWTDQQMMELHHFLVSEYYSHLSTRERKQKKWITMTQLRVIMNNMMVVCMGIRPSCLVDCCLMEKDLVEFLLQVLSRQTHHHPWHGYRFEHIYAVVVNGNVFFINVAAFLREKMIELASNLQDLVVVNVSAELEQPILLQKEQDYARLSHVEYTIVSICRQLLHLVDSRHSQGLSRVLDLDERNIPLHCTAIAGLLLCYPVVYDLYDPHRDEKTIISSSNADVGWSKEENCLSMCPLFVLQTAVSTREQSAVLLQEFSIPQHLLQSAPRTSTTTSRAAAGLSIALLKAHSKTKLQLDAGEFTVAWLTFKGDAVEDEQHRFYAKKEELVSSKLFRALFGEATMKCFEELNGDRISKEAFISILALCYDGNTEDRISYVFSMYNIVYSGEREEEGVITETDYYSLLEYLADFNSVPKKFYAAFEECNIPAGGILSNSKFVEWVRRYPVLMEFLAYHLPPSTLPSSPLSIHTSEEHLANTDLLNHSPSCRADKSKSGNQFSSFDFIGGEDSGDDSDELYDSDQISEMEDMAGSFHDGGLRDSQDDLPTPDPDILFGEFQSHHGDHDEATATTPLFNNGSSTPSGRRGSGTGKTSSRPRGVQKMGRHIGKTVGSGISKVGRSILHAGKSQVHQASHGKTHYADADPAASALLAAGYSFSSESQISKDYVCGYLHKISDGKWSKRSWHRRWFVLDRQKGIISYYRHNPANHIPSSSHGNIVHMEEQDPVAGEKMLGQSQNQVIKTNSNSSAPSMSDGVRGPMETVTAAKDTAITKSGANDEGQHDKHQLLYLNKAHPWFRGDLDLNMDNVSLLFEKSFAKNAPTSYYFQISTLSLQDIESKRGVQFKLCADNEVDFDHWTHAIAEVINRKHTQNVSSDKGPVLSHQQLYRQKLQQEQQKQKESGGHELPFDTPSTISPDENAEERRTSTLKKETDTTSLSAPSAPSPSKPSLPPIRTHFPVPQPLVPSQWRLQVTIDGTKQCLIVGFVLNIVALKCLASEHVLWKVFVCISVTCGFVMSTYNPRPLYPIPAMNVGSDRKTSEHQGNVDTAILGTDISQCGDPLNCCLHKATSFGGSSMGLVGLERMPSTGSSGIPGMGLGMGGVFEKFVMGSSMKRTEMIPSGKSSNVPHSWTTTKAEFFSIRGSDYKKSRRKQPSEPALFEFLAADLLRTDRKVDLISQRVELPEEFVDEKLFIINAQLPSYGPSVWGEATYDGPGYSLVLYWKIPNSVHEALKDPQTKTLKLLKRFLEAGNDTSLTDRFKVIAQVSNQDECGITGMGKKLLVSHNATPVLTRPQHRIYHFNEGSTEIVVDIHAFSYIARRGIHLLLDKTTKLVIDIGFVLQGETEDELPEQILGCCRLDHPDVQMAMPMPQ